MEEEFFDEEFEPGYQLEVGIDDIYLMYHCVKETIKNWLWFSSKTCRGAAATLGFKR